MKMNWGGKLMLFFGAFIALIVFMVVKSTQQKIDLVTTNYYEKEQQYQEKINQSEEALKLGAVFKWEISKEAVTLKYIGIDSSENISGTVSFFRPSDKNMDDEAPLILSENKTQKFEMNKFAKGLYKVQINWSNGQVNYYSEENIFIP